MLQINSDWLGAGSTHNVNMGKEGNESTGPTHRM